MGFEERGGATMASPVAHLGIPWQRSYRPYGTDRFSTQFQARNCLATIIQSLRDANTPARPIAVSPFRPFAHLPQRRAKNCPFSTVTACPCRTVRSPWTDNHNSPPRSEHWNAGRLFFANFFAQ